MAKRKTPKAKDLRPQNVTAEELNKLQELVNLINQGKVQLGNIEVNKHALLHQITGVQEQIGLLQKDFEKTYGNVDINITPKGEGLVKIAAGDFNLAGQTVTATGNELNLTDGSSAGTIVNSKAVIYGSSGEVNATTLQIAGTSITATAAELNYVDGVTSAIQTQLDAKATKGFATAMAIAL